MGFNSMQALVTIIFIYVCFMFVNDFGQDPDMTLVYLLLIMAIPVIYGLYTFKHPLCPKCGRYTGKVMKINTLSRKTVSKNVTKTGSVGTIFTDTYVPFKYDTTELVEQVKVRDMIKCTNPECGHEWTRTRKGEF